MDLILVTADTEGSMVLTLAGVSIPVPQVILSVFSYIAIMIPAHYGSQCISQLKAFNDLLAYPSPAHSCLPNLCDCSHHNSISAAQSNHPN